MNRCAGCASAALIALLVASCQLKVQSDLVDAAATSAGATSWYTFLGGSGTESVSSVQQTADGGYIIIGSSTADIPSLGGQTPLNAYSTGTNPLLIKLKSDGGVSWYTFLGAAGSPIGGQQTNDGGYVLAMNASANIPNLGGQTPLNAYSAGTDPVVIKLNSTGGVSWYTFLGGAGTESAKGITQTTDGGYVLAASSSANIANFGAATPIIAYSASDDPMVIKLTSAGAVSWYTFLGSTGGDNGRAIDKTSDGGCIVAIQSGANIANLGGQTPVLAFTSGGDGMVVKLTSAGAVSWYAFLNGMDPKSIKQSSDGSYGIASYRGSNIANLGGQTPVIAYSASFDGVAIKLTSGGAVSWYTYLGGSGTDNAYAMSPTSDGGYIVGANAGLNIATLGGQTPLNAFYNGGDALLVKLTSAGAISWYTFYGGNGSDTALSVQQTSDGGFISAGTSTSNISNLGSLTPLNAYSAGTDISVVKLKDTGGL